jgi:tetraacyldisaccharide 4'-kinase
MRPPGFWYTPPDRPDLRARILSPLGWLYGQVTARRMARAGAWRAPLPVICVGDLDAGGTGSTPAVQALALHLQARGRAPAILSCGHGGRRNAPVRIDPQNHTATDVGYAALLHAAFAPTWVAQNPATGARAIAQNARAGAMAADCILLENGLQDPFLVKDLSLIVVDAVTGFGNGRCIPAGPLREPVKQGLSRADLLLSIGSPAAQEAFHLTWGDRVDVAGIRCRMEPLQTGMDWHGARILGFAGIGQPERFFAMLRDLGADLVRAEALENHQPLTGALMTRLDREAQTLGAQLVTTETDAVRLPHTFRHRVLTLPVRLRIEDPGPLDAALDRIGL